MNKQYIEIIAKDLEINKWQVEHCIELLEEGSTIPFISRYRKERTGSLDEVQIAQIKHYQTRYTELDKRKTSILASIEEQGKLTDDLRIIINECFEMQRLEDIYLPYRPKRRTRASISREKGLEPLAEIIFNFKSENPLSSASKYINDDVKSADEALDGARDIIAEWVSENIGVRESLRNQYLRYAKLVSKKQKDIPQ